MLLNCLHFAFEEHCLFVLVVEKVLGQPMVPVAEVVALVEIRE